MKKLLIVLALLGLSAGHAYAWWNGDWSYRKKIDLDAGPTGAAVTDPIGPTQVLVRLFEGNFKFSDAMDDGSDLRFVAGDDKTPLKFHIEKWDSLLNQVALIWVDVPDMAPGATTAIYMYYGNSKATAAGDPKATYDPDQILVYHFNDQNGLAHDQTAFGNNALTPAKPDEAGLIGQGGKLDGTAPIRIGASPSLALSANQPLTWTAWVRFDAQHATGVLYAQRDPEAGLVIGLDNGVAYAKTVNAGSTTRTSPGTALKPDTWHHVALVASDRLRLFVDGQAAGEAASGLPQVHAAPAIGGDPSAATLASNAAGALVKGTNGAGQTVASAPVAAANFVGQMDEVEIAKAARPLGAIQVAARGQGADAKLLNYEPDEENSSFGGGYIGVILNSVTIDGWVVIGVLAVMAVISWMVMLSKAIYIGRLGRANALFVEVFRNEAGRRGLHDPAAFTAIRGEDRPALRRSSLFRIYELGAQELTNRVGNGDRGTLFALAPQSIAAIRAALDGRMVRENQRLNRLMTLLTIAISGGPFIGLLGTVMGVMITFAAIAAAGDVNVNAIAPGIAAALVATVAGLLVAIPALFAYNYLTVRIKDATADMQVFADELVTRMAEIYRGSSERKLTDAA